MKRKRFVSINRLVSTVLAVAIFTSTGAATAAESYPSKPIRVIVSWGAGGSADLYTRPVAEKMSQNMGQPILVENRPGARLVPGAMATLQSPADGYTMMTSATGHAISHSLFKALPYNVVTDFAQVAVIGTSDLLVCVNRDSKFASLGDVVAFAKSNPGKLNLGTMAPGTTLHLSGVLFKSAAKIDAVVVPYKTSGDAFVALRSNAVDLVFEFLSTALPHIQSGTVKALAIASAKRYPSLPDTPTTAEGGLADYLVNSWTSISVRSGTPRPIIDLLNKEALAAIKSPEVTRRLQGLYLRELGGPSGSSTPEQTRELMVSDIAKWKKVIEAANIPRQ